MSTPRSSCWVGRDTELTGRIFTGCVSTAAATKGSLRVIDPQASETCKATEKQVTWNQRGANWRGAWTASATYAINDAVAFQGSSYIATASNTATVPTTTTKWAVLAHAGSPTKPNVHFAQSSGTSTMSASGGVNWQTTPAAFQLPAGKYLLERHATVVDFGPSGIDDVFRCAVESDDMSRIGPAATQLQGSSGQSVQTIGNQSVVSYTSTNLVTLECWHDKNLPAGSYYIDPGATLSATAIA